MIYGYRINYLLLSMKPDMINIIIPSIIDTFTLIQLNVIYTILMLLSTVFVTHYLLKFKRTALVVWFFHQYNLSVRFAIVLFSNNDNGLAYNSKMYNLAGSCDHVYVRNKYFIIHYII